MKDEKTKCECGCDCECCKPKHWHHRGHHDATGGSIYGLGMIGVAIYFIQQVHGFWPIVVAILKAIVWPAFLLYRIFDMLHM